MKDLANLLAAVALALPGQALADSFSGADYPASELLNTCLEADNDSRRGTELETECEQYIMGFVDAMAETGGVGPAVGVCPPRENTADEVRWAFTRWVYGAYGERTGMDAADALYASLIESFPCE